MSERKRLVFPETFKREAVERVRTSRLPVTTVAAELGLHSTVLGRWVQKYGAEPERAALWRRIAQAASPSPADLAAENARLKRELEKAKMERDILKKAALIFGTASR